MYNEKQRFANFLNTAIMKPKEINFLVLDLTKDESETLDYKEKVVDSVYATLSAFCNTSGGKIILGVSDKKEIKGIDLTNGKQESIINKAIDLLGIQPKILTQLIDDKSIMIISVKKSSNPIPYKGKYYKRVGNTTREMGREEFKAMLLKEVGWDTLTNDCSLDEINEETLREFIKLANDNKRLPLIQDDENIESILERLDLIIDRKITNAAILLFGKNPQKYFSNATLRIGAFKDNEGTIIIGDKQIKGSLFKQATEGQEALKFYNNVHYKISGALQREEVWDYPLDAMREALLNALIHRDYFDASSEIQIKILKDSLWIYNPGGLMSGLSIEKLRSMHPSKARNKLLMNIFYLSGMVERFGSGIGRIVKSCKESLIPEPEFKEEFGGFSVYFKKEFTELNERQKKAIKYIKENKRITSNEYQNLVETAKATIKRDLSEMCNKEIIKMIKEGRNTYYIINEP